MGTGKETGSSRHGLTAAGEGMRPVRDGGCIPMNQYYNMDCMDGMKQFPDK